jgi:histidine ammonia-lyase
MVVELNGQALSLSQVVAVARERATVRIGAEGLARLVRGRASVERLNTADGRPVYGVNTGFGTLSRVRIPPEQIDQLQLNLVRSHAVGAGEPLSEEVVRAMLLLLAASLVRGHSGVRPEVVALIVDCLNHGLHPVVPSRGSVGASGDLAPLAHIALALIGEGKLRRAGQTRPAAEALAAEGLSPLQLRAKEGLALLNGTHLMTAIGALLMQDADNLLKAAVLAAAMSLEGALGTHTALDARIHALRGQAGQIIIATQMRELLAGSELPASHSDDPRVQDPYSLRCAPQVLGAVHDVLGYIRGVIEAELGAVTDNPLIMSEGDIVSGGNFHGAPLALALDTLAIALSHLAGIAERRIYLLVSAEEPEMHLPKFLTRASGLQSGLMIAQYTAAALVNECATLAAPASVINVPTSAGMEDWNSMGATSALKAQRVLENARRVVAIELICAAQALELHRPLRSGPGVEAALAHIRALVRAYTEDRSLADDIILIEQWIAA